jgi:hypothetical protein
MPPVPNCGNKKGRIHQHLVAMTTRVAVVSGCTAQFICLLGLVTGCVRPQASAPAYQRPAAEQATFDDSMVRGQKARDEFYACSTTYALDRRASGLTATELATAAVGACADHLGDVRREFVRGGLALGASDVYTKADHLVTDLTEMAKSKVLQALAEH